MLSEADLQREATETGFGSEALEKVIRLMELLEGLRSHPFLKTRIALKGGTALSAPLTRHNHAAQAVSVSIPSYS